MVLNVPSTPIKVSVDPLIVVLQTPYAELLDSCVIWSPALTIFDDDNVIVISVTAVKICVEVFVSEASVGELVETCNPVESKKTTPFVL